MNEKDKFLKEVKNDAPVLEDEQFKDLLDKHSPKAPEAEPEKDDEEKPKTRRYKRLEQKNKEMEQMLVEMNDRIKELSEKEKFLKANPQLDPLEVKVLGTDENGQLIKSYLDTRFDEVRQKTREEVMQELESERKAEAQAAARDVAEVDDIFEGLEERFNVNLNNPKNKAEKDFVNGFVDFYEGLSPKDEQGNIVSFADPDTSFETYLKISQNSKPRETSERQKALASRSMTEGGRAIPEAPKGPVTFKNVGRMLDAWRAQQ